MHTIPRSLQVLSAVALVWGIGLTAAHTILLGNLTAPGSSLIPSNTEMELHAAASASFGRVDAGIQLTIGILLIVLGFFLHALGRMQNGERPVHITVKDTKKKRRMWYWIEMRI